MTERLERIIKLHPKFKDNFLWKDERKYSRFEAWLDLFSEAHPQTVRRGGKEIQTDDGILAVPMTSTQKRWAWDTKEFSDFFDLLKKEEMIDMAFSPMPRPFDDPIFIVKIINYKKYQGIGSPKKESEVSIIEMSDVREVLGCWSTYWEEIYGRKPIAHAKNIIAIKSLLKNLSKPEIFSAIERFFKDSSEFVTTSKHSLHVFVARINNYLTNDGYGTGRLS